MKSSGYSILEVLVAAVVIAVGLSAGAGLVRAIMVSEEVAAGASVAVNLHEQATMLYRLDLPPATIRAILPERCVTGATPSEGTYSIEFGAEQPTPLTAAPGGEFAVGVTDCTMVSPVAGSYDTTVHKVVRPLLRWTHDN